MEGLFARLDEELNDSQLPSAPHDEDPDAEMAGASSFGVVNFCSKCAFVLLPAGSEAREGAATTAADGSGDCTWCRQLLKLIDDDTAEARDQVPGPDSEDWPSF
eukprot:2652332-Pyramimonas_sp.AAC.1